MNDGALHRDKAAHHAGMLVAAALRAIDAGVRVLQRLRNRFEAPVDDDDSLRAGAKRNRSVSDEPAAAAVAAPQQTPLWQRALIVLLCLLLGAGTGSLVSYRGFAKLLSSRDAVIEYMQDEIDKSKKEEVLNLNAKAKYQGEIVEYRKQLRETQQGLEDYKSQVEELSGKLAAMTRAERPAPPSGNTATAAAAKPRAPQKTASCVTGTANLNGNLANCLDKFNRP